MNLSNQLDRRITIETAIESKENTGEITYTWIVFATVWARYMPIRGREYFAAQQINASIDATFRIRYIPNLTTVHRIKWDGKLWDIQSIIEIGRREGLDIMARIQRI